MIKKIKLLIAGLAAAAMIALPLAMPAAVYAADAPSETLKGGLCQGANLEVSPSATNCPIDQQATNDKVNGTITWVINVFSIVVGVAAVIMIIIGGLRYIISGGDSGNVTSAKNTILYAIIGLVVVALSQFIVKFVLTKINATP